MLLKVVLPFEGLAANLAGKGNVVLVAAFVYHEVIGFCETTLAVLAHELYAALGAHLLSPREFPAVPLRFHGHYREHPYKFPPPARSWLPLYLYRRTSIASPLSEDAPT